MRKTIRYQPLLSLAASYQVGTDSWQSEGLSWLMPTTTTRQLHNGRLHSRHQGGRLTIYFEAIEIPAASPNSVSALIENPNKPLLFFLQLDDASQLHKLNFHSNPQLQKELGFPVFYHGGQQGADANIELQTDVKVLPALFEYRVFAEETGLNREAATWQILNEKLEEISYAPVAKRIVEQDTIQYISSFDFSKLPPEVYTLTLGNYSLRIFISSLPPPSCHAVVRLNTQSLVYSESIDDPVYPTFQLEIATH